MLSAIRNNLVLFFLSILLILFNLPILSAMTLMSGDDDWLSVYIHHHHFRDSIINFGQIPLWSRFLSGGYPIGGYPEYPLLSPLTIFTLIANEIVGTKLIVLFFYALQLLGIYLFSKEVLKFNSFGVLVSSIIIAFSNWLPWSVRDGNMIEMYPCFFPLLLYFLHKSRQNKTALLYFGFFLSLVIYDGNVTFLSLIIMLGLYTLLFGGNLKTPLPNHLSVFLLIGVITALLLSSARLLPMINLLKIDSRVINNYLLASENSYTFNGLWQSLTRRIPEQGITFSVSRLHIGVLPLICSVFYLFNKNGFKWGIFLISAMLLSMAHNTIFDLFYVLWNLPLYQSMRNPAKYFDYYIIFSIAILSGGFINWIWKSRSKYFSIIITFIILFSFSFVFMDNMKTQSNVFYINAPQGKTNRFYQIQGLNLLRYGERPQKANYYINVKNNIGIVDWKSNINLGEYATPEYYVNNNNQLIYNDKYKGEVYFINNKINTISQILWKPNNITLTLNVMMPDLLVINQNFNNNWKSTSYPVINQNGLISLEIKKTGKQTISLQYDEPLFNAAVALNLIIYAIFLTILLKSSEFEKIKINE